MALDRAVHETEQEERKRISENLHDSVVQNLVVAKMNIESLKNYAAHLPEEGMPIIDNIQTLVAQSTLEIRRISHTILPLRIEEEGLGRVVHDLSFRLIHTDVKVEVFTNGEFRVLTKNQAIVAYRIIQECLQNALKHAKASMIHISLAIDQDVLEVSVEDDGVGFDEKVVKGRGIGLESIKSRILYLKGSFDIESALGKGTCVQFQLPLNYNSSYDTTP